MTDGQRSTPESGEGQLPDAPREHELATFLRQDMDEIASEYGRIYSRSTEDPGTAGDEGEENWAKLLREWLPPAYQVVTKGRILGADGSASPHIDVLVLKPSYPARLVTKKVYLVSGVAAAFECKTTLKRVHLGQAAKTARAVRALSKQRTGSPYREITGSPLFGVLAHSHSWKSPGSKPHANVENALREDAIAAAHPRDLLDLVCVADLNAWHLLKTPYMGRAVVGDFWDELKGVYRSGEAGTVIGAFVGSDPALAERRFNPLATMIALLLQNLAWEDPSIRPMADYFRLAGLWVEGSGQQLHWRVDTVYTPEVADLLNNGASLSGTRWSEWATSMP